MKKKITRFLFLGLSIISSITLLNSCINNDDAPITEPNRHTIVDIKSYGDLFEVFWQTMDQRYNYFQEQKRRDGMDWNAIYREYSPKFKALRTFNRTTDDDKEMYDDYLKANQYFEEIIDPIIDKHFYVNIYFSLNNKNAHKYVKYFGGMLSKEKEQNHYSFMYKYQYMKDRVLPNSFTENGSLIAGYLKSNPDIYYFTFDQFNLLQKYSIKLRDKYFIPDNGEGLFLSENKIDASKELNAIKDINTRKKVRDFTVGVLNKWNEFPTSEEVAKFNDEVTKFQNTEIVSDELIDAGIKVIVKSNSLIDYYNIDIYSSVLTPETTSYINSFRNSMQKHVMEGYALGFLQLEILTALGNAPLYQQFFNPLHKGEIKKIILDLRSNLGGAVLDARFFSDRFITKNEIFGFQRTKEGNGRFNYTPWVEVRTSPYKFGIPANIPITILTDKRTASMSEITTLMLKSQGNHVISVGDYSQGATAGLGNSDDFNGGNRDEIGGGRLTFNMPLLAMKDAKGKVIEGIGIKPDIYVTPPTDEEITAMQTSPSTFVDRVLDTAINYLTSK